MRFPSSAVRVRQAALRAVWLAALMAATGGAGRLEPGDDRTFRPTVVIRHGAAQGSGTVIASTARETLVLTAAHVVEGPGPLVVELHRYNFGLERKAAPAGWPRALSGELAAADADADVAVLRLRKIGALPFVAQLAGDGSEPRPGAVVTSVGIDRGTRLRSWKSRVAEVDWFGIEGAGAERLFLVTERVPEQGRSGGGLFLGNGDLAGVCIGHAEIVKGRRSGVFASGASVRRLLRDHGLSAALAAPKMPAAP